MEHLLERLPCMGKLQATDLFSFGWLFARHLSKNFSVFYFKCITGSKEVNKKKNKPKRVYCLFPILLGVRIN